MIWKLKDILGAEIQEKKCRLCHFTDRKGKLTVIYLYTCVSVCNILFSLAFSVVYYMNLNFMLIILPYHIPGEAEEFQPSASYHKEPVNIHGKRVTHVWHRSLRSELPVSCSLAISLLVCHMAREPILPTDILKWALEGKLPYLSAFVEIEKQLGSCTRACPIPASRMFRPILLISSQKLESMAADIALKIGLKMPPVNFYSIALRYLRQLSLPTEKVLPSACHIYEWSMPSELYLSANDNRIPTRACVMSILIVAIRNLFDIHGYGVWESSLSDPSCSSSRVKNGDNGSRSHLNKNENAEDPRLSVVELLQFLYTKYDELADVHGNSSWTGNLILNRNSVLIFSFFL